MERYDYANTGMIFFVVLFLELFGGVHRMFYMRAEEEDAKFTQLKDNIPLETAQQQKDL